MDRFAEFERYDGIGLAALLREKQVSPDELLDAPCPRLARR